MAGPLTRKRKADQGDHCDNGTGYPRRASDLLHCLAAVPHLLPQPVDVLRLVVDFGYESPLEHALKRVRTWLDDLQRVQYGDLKPKACPCPWPLPYVHFEDLPRYYRRRLKLDPTPAGPYLDRADLAMWLVRYSHPLANAHGSIRNTLTSLVQWDVVSSRFNPSGAYCAFWSENAASEPVRRHLSVAFGK
jgi:hypothetical protein